MRPRTHWLRRPELWIMLFLLLFTLVNRWPLLSKLDTHTYYTAYDYCIYNWELLWNCHTLETLNFAGYWASNGMYPYPHAFAFSENMIGLTPFAFPIWVISRNPILTINLLQLFLMWLTAAATFFAIRKMVGGGLPALAGTMAFAFYPYLSWSFSIGHPHILGMMWIPLVMFANWRFWQSGKLRYLLGMSGLWFWTFLISVYLGIFLTVFMVIWNFIWFLHEKKLFPMKKILRWGAAVFLAWALMIPVFLVYMGVTRDMGVVRTLEQQERFTGNVWSWLSVPPDNWLWAQKLQALPPSLLQSYEDAMFPGLITLLLFVASFFVKGMPQWLKSLRWTALILAIFALGPYALGIPWKIPLPFILLYYAFPPLWATRNPHRWGLFTMLIAGFLIAYLLQRLPAKRKYMLLTLLVIAGIALETWTFIRPSEAMHPGNTALYQNLAERDGKHVIAELPMARVWGHWGWETRSLLGSTYHWQTVLNGITGLWPALQFQLGNELHEFPSPHTVAMLQAMDVDRIVLNEHKMRRKFAELRPIIETTREMRFRKRFNKSSIWSLKRGKTRSVLEPANDFVISSPSRLLAGRITLGIEIPRAESVMVFNPKAPAQWKFPIAKPWVIRDRSAGETPPPDFAWMAPGLFHYRNSRFPVTLDIQPGQKTVELELDIMGEKVALRQPVEVVGEGKASAAMPPFLRLPQGFSEIPFEATQADLTVSLPDGFKGLAGETVDFTVGVRNPGPFYWPADPSRGVLLGLTLVSDGMVMEYEFPLAHDLFPGDGYRLHAHVLLPYGSKANRIAVNCFGRSREGERFWFSDANAKQIF